MRTFVVTDRESLEQTLESAARGDKIIIAEGAFPERPRLVHDGNRWKEAPAPSPVTATSTSTGWKLPAVSCSPRLPATLTWTLPAGPAVGDPGDTAAHAVGRVVDDELQGAFRAEAGAVPAPDGIVGRLLATRVYDRGVRRRIAWDVDPDGVITGRLIE
jgi:hypothetical protein